MNTRKRPAIGLALALALGLVALSLLVSPAPPPARAAGPYWAPATPPPLMAGDVLWNGVPSFMWGSNDTQIWDSDYSIITEPAIQREVAADHLALQRTWLFQTDLATNQPETDAYQQSKVNANLATGAKLLCELATENSMAYDEHMVSLFKGKCSFYEFMNEPDDEGYTSATYLPLWKSEIPRLRAIDPGAKFGGPAATEPEYNDCTYYTDGTQACFLQKVIEGMASSGVLPDFISFHWYPCWNDSADSCMARARSYGDVVTQVRGWVNTYLPNGARIPVGITEWNADPSAPMPGFTQDACWLENFTTVAEESAARAGASFMNQFDLADYGGYGSDDMVDIYKNGAAKPQYYALLHVVNQIYPNGALPMPPLGFTQPSKCPAPPPVWGTTGAPAPPTSIAHGAGTATQIPTPARSPFPTGAASTTPSAAPAQADSPAPNTLPAPPASSRPAPLPNTILGASTAVIGGIGLIVMWTVRRGRKRP